MQPLPTPVDVSLMLALARDEELLSTPSSWTPIVRAAAHHGLLGVVGRARALCADAPPELITRLREGEEAAAAWRAHLVHALARVRAALDDVPHLVLKGPPLAARLYDPPHDRVSLDLDVLVRPHDRARAGEAVRTLGYRPLVAPEIRDHVEDPFVHDELPPLELHFAAHRGFGRPLAAEPLLERRARAGGAFVLSPIDELPYLAAHAASHRFDRLVWVLDLARLVERSPQLLGPWGSRAEELGVREATAVGLALAHELFLAPAPSISRLRWLRSLLPHEGSRVPRVLANGLFWMGVADDPHAAVRVLSDKLRLDGPRRLWQTLSRLAPRRAPPRLRTGAAAAAASLVPRGTARRAPPRDRAPDGPRIGGRRAPDHAAYGADRGMAPALRHLPLPRAHEARRPARHGTPCGLRDGARADVGLAVRARLGRARR